MKWFIIEMFSFFGGSDGSQGLDSNTQEDIMTAKMPVNLFLIH